MEIHVSESIEIAAPPSVVYTAVTNVADMGRWSPECTGADVKDNGLQEVRPGMKFTGHNRSAKRPWSTQCTVIAAEPGERFAFLARGVGLRVAIWTYRFEPLDFGQATKVTETWIDQRGWFMHFISPKVSGIRDRATHNRQTMKVTLQRLKKTLEKEHPSPEAVCGDTGPVGPDHSRAASGRRLDGVDHERTEGHHSAPGRAGH